MLALNELRPHRLSRGFRQSEVLSNSVIHLFIRRCVLELSQLQFDEQIKLYNRFVRFFCLTGRMSTCMMTLG